ncbi:alpha/beta fold hydrolase [Mycolicibacterium fallax]|uniref:Hydrolase n=1 Tax=Mycolicibacterium fallax TaxID=1793 RepID=A0A1X1REY5_MYCFA|nr:alpha/beta hydrolase [Mycolicibacterium fallax]ORV04320.1 hydrolase [Mycolicibacterium fallax]
MRPVRDAIHLGSGEPVLLLHPFMMSQNVWKDVAPMLADTGRYEVYAPTMPGHNGGVKARMFLDTKELADDVERRMDELGWPTAHIVGNSLGGWVAFEMMRRGRARTLTAIAPAGGWRHFSPVKFEIVAKFLLGFPVWIIAKLLGAGRVLKFPFTRWFASVPISATPQALPEADLPAILDDVTHCAAYYQLLVKALLLPGLQELANADAPTNLVLCEKDRVLPHPRFARQFIRELPADTVVTRMDRVGHIPMFEDPARTAALITDFIEANRVPPAAEQPA